MFVRRLFVKNFFIVLLLITIVTKFKIGLIIIRVMIIMRLLIRMVIKRASMIPTRSFISTASSAGRYHWCWLLLSNLRVLIDHSSYFNWLVVCCSLWILRISKIFTNIGFYCLAFRQLVLYIIRRRWATAVIFCLLPFGTVMLLHCTALMLRLAIVVVQIWAAWSSPSASTELLIVIRAAIIAAPMNLLIIVWCIMMLNAIAWLLLIMLHRI